MILPVPAIEPWTDTGIDVSAGQTLIFSAAKRWTDWIIETDADGFDRIWLKPLAGSRRVPGAPWFALCGALDSDLATAFVIGSASAHTFEIAGRLMVFANDVPWAYCNNKGALNLTVTS